MVFAPGWWHGGIRAVVFALLFLLAILLVEGWKPPGWNAEFAAFVVGAALIQIAATALMLAAMQLRSFAVTTVYAIAGLRLITVT